MSASIAVPLPRPHALLPAVLFPLLYVATIMPFLVFFVEGNPPVGFTDFELFITAMFGVDMLISFNSAYYDENSELVHDRSVRAGLQLACCPNVAVTQESVSSPVRRFSHFV